MSTSTENPIVAAIRGGTAPEHVRAAAAKGALPIPRGTLIQLFVELLHDEVVTIRTDAEKSLQELDNEAIKEALGDEACPAQVLIYFSKRAAKEATLAESIAFHPSSPIPALTILAALGNNAVIDLVLTNEQVLLRQPGLLEKMMLNPALGQHHRGRLLELLDRAAKRGEEAAEAAKEAGEAEQEAAADEAEEEVEEETIEELAALLEVDVGELLSASEILGAEELEASEDPEVQNAFQKIIALNPAQKAILAMKGDREERLILVRDSNKVVAMGVLKNPRITETEVEAIAKMRNVTEDVLRVLGNTREWAKNYTVIHSLVNNPKTPQSVSVNFIKRLNNRDLQGLLRSRDIPELIRRMARKTWEQRNRRPKMPGKK
ncbi:MAG: hypothetical protein GTN89_08940 [Acidobacteria bacterium]|nr:hypothetical protein [Acidobacteriota bacterium]NIM60091.1 hypothetical protein [Acidobacteriota bacterium]NIO59449.1 hypothetical protein [Acidobacteriota bacterium]NIQ30480.1 hypothetical protein [Acidobacteriota bacterium]NIQ85419.1 hypothetical protein [Acidobacteriota bacterium]